MVAGNYIPIRSRYGTRINNSPARNCRAIERKIMNIIIGEIINVRVMGRVLEAEVLDVGYDYVTVYVYDLGVSRVVNIMDVC